MRRNNVESFMEIGTSLVYVGGSKLSEKLYVVKTKKILERVSEGDK